MENILKQGIYPTLGPYRCRSYPSCIVSRTMNCINISQSWNNSINFKYQFVKVWHEVPEFIKCERSYLHFKIALSEFSLAKYWCSSLLSYIFQLILIFYWCLKNLSSKWERNIYIHYNCALLSVSWTERSLSIWFIWPWFFRAELCIYHCIFIFNYFLSTLVIW